MNTPVIETERLRLRGHVKTDFDASFAMWSDPVTTKFIGGKPSTRQQAWSRLMHYRGHWELMGFGYWAVEEKKTGMFVGEIGFGDFKRDLTPSIEGLPELGWALAPRFHGQGFATEALKAAIEWGEKPLTMSGLGSIDRMVCMIDPANSPSLKVAEKIGFKEIARTTYADAPTILFERKILRV